MSAAHPALRKTQGDWFRDPRADCRGAFRIPFPEQVHRLTVPLAAELLEEVHASRVAAGGQRLIGAVLEHTDFKTRVCSRRRAYLLKQARVSERWATMLVTACVGAGLLTRLEFEAKHTNLRPPYPNELKGSEEWELGCWVLRWEALTARQVREQLGQVPGIVARLKGASRRGGANVQGVDPGIAPRSIPGSPPGRSRDRPPADPGIDPSIAPKGFLDLDPSLSFDRLPLPSINTPTSALSPHEGDPGSSTPSPLPERGPFSRVAPPVLPSPQSERAASPSATRLSSDSVAPLLGAPDPQEGCGGRESAADLYEAPVLESGTCPSGDAVGLPEPMSTEDGASARPMPEMERKTSVRFLPETSRAISALVGRCTAFTEAARLPGKYDAAVLFAWCVAQHRHGLALEWLEAWAVGVARGGGEARAGRTNAKAQGVNAFHYATGNAEVYVQEGRRVLEAERYALEPEPPPPAAPSPSPRRPALSRDQLAFLAELEPEQAARVLAAMTEPEKDS